MAKYGFARAVSVELLLAQTEVLKTVVDEDNIFTSITGDTNSDLMIDLLNALEAGDILYIVNEEAFSRNTARFFELYSDVSRTGAGIIVLNDGDVFYQHMEDYFMGVYGNTVNSIDITTPNNIIDRYGFMVNDSTVVTESDGVITMETMLGDNTTLKKVIDGNVITVLVIKDDLVVKSISTDSADGGTEIITVVDRGRTEIITNSPDGSRSIKINIVRADSVVDVDFNPDGTGNYTVTYNDGRISKFITASDGNVLREFFDGVDTRYVETVDADGNVVAKKFVGDVEVPVTEPCPECEECEECPEVTSIARVLDDGSTIITNVADDNTVTVSRQNGNNTVVFSVTLPNGDVIRSFTLDGDMLVTTTHDVDGNSKRVLVNDSTTVVIDTDVLGNITTVDDNDETTITLRMTDGVITRDISYKDTGGTHKSVTTVEGDYDITFTDTDGNETKTLVSPDGSVISNKYDSNGDLIVEEKPFEEVTHTFVGDNAATTITVSTDSSIEHKLVEGDIITAVEISPLGGVLHEVTDGEKETTIEIENDIVALSYVKDNSDVIRTMSSDGSYVHQDDKRNIAQGTDGSIDLEYQVEGGGTIEHSVTPSGEVVTIRRDADGVIIEDVETTETKEDTDVTLPDGSLVEIITTSDGISKRITRPNGIIVEVKSFVDGTIKREVTDISGNTRTTITDIDGGVHTTAVSDNITIETTRDINGNTVERLVFATGKVIERYIKPNGSMVSNITHSNGKTVNTTTDVIGGDIKRITTVDGDVITIVSSKNGNTTKTVNYTNGDELFLSSSDNRISRFFTDSDGVKTNLLIDDSTSVSKKVTETDGSITINKITEDNILIVTFTDVDGNDDTRSIDLNDIDTLVSCVKNEEDDTTVEDNDETTDVNNTLPFELVDGILITIIDDKLGNLDANDMDGGSVLISDGVIKRLLMSSEIVIHTVATKEEVKLLPEFANSGNDVAVNIVINEYNGTGDDKDEETTDDDTETDNQDDDTETTEETGSNEDDTSDTTDTDNDDDTEQEVEVVETDGDGNTTTTKVPVGDYTLISGDLYTNVLDMYGKGYTSSEISSKLREAQVHILRILRALGII